LGVLKDKQDCELKHVLPFTDTNRKASRKELESESKQREGEDEYKGRQAGRWMDKWMGKNNVNEEGREGKKLIKKRRSKPRK